jgi:hypothetical protein
VTYLCTDLLTVVEAVEILSPSHYVLSGISRELPEQDPWVDQSTTPLVHDLADDLYWRMYVHLADPPRGKTSGWDARRQFLASLSAANSGRGTWTPGWHIVRVEQSGDVAVKRGELTFWASPAEIRPEEGSAEPGVLCWVLVPKELRHLHPGTYFALGDTPSSYLHTDPGGGRWPLVRTFWHLSAAIAVEFVSAVTRELNALAVPFRLKVQSDPNDYRRADAGVLYLRREDALAHPDAIARIYRAVAPGLRPEVPLLTYRLAHGLALAEDPGDDSSYGLHRCTLVAQALWRSFQQGETTLAARANTLAAVFHETGLDPLHPYLGPGSHLEDLRPAFPDVAAAAVVTSVEVISSEPEPLPAHPVSPLDAALVAGRAICRAAVWDREHQFCNWLAYRSIEDAQTDSSRQFPAALGPDLYGGSAGIALFLAELHALTGDLDCCRTALAALARSLRQARRSPGDLASPFSLYNGLLGLAYVAGRVAILTGKSELTTEAARIVDQLASDAGSAHPLDLLGGTAGAILALLVLSKTSTRNTERQLAVALGHDLCRTANRRGGVWSWDPDRASGPGIASVPLTGLSHGAAGIALALLELHGATGQSEFLEAARGAFAYEDSLFDSRAGNWPDLRIHEGDEPGSAPVRFAGGWCNGAPGIALARLRASDLDPEYRDTHLAVARIALATTLQVIERNRRVPGQDESLCHGLAGLLDIALVAGSHLGDRGCLEQAARAARAIMARLVPGIEESTSCSSRWSDPSFMLGLAGSGYALLRLHAADRVPSILLPGGADQRADDPSSR